MAYQDHLLRYRLMTNDQLTAEAARLAALNSGFSQQAMGSKNYVIAVAQVLDQQNAVAFVMRERGYSVPDSVATRPTTVGITDFSCIQ